MSPSLRIESRQRHPSCWIFGLLSLVLACADGGQGSSGASRPDVILIVVDTLRADHTSLLGYARATTPNLERFATRGAVFERCLSASSWTLPSMAMLFAGAYDARNSGVLDQAWTSLPEAFQGAGYQTSAVLANPILGGPEADFATGFERGFAHFEVVPRRFGLRAGVHRQTNGWYADEVVSRVKEQLKGPVKAPRFVWLHLFDPHFPRLPRSPELFAGSADPGPAPGLPVTAEEATYIEHERRAYDAEIAGADAALGDLFAWLATEGRLANTLVVLTADHGEGLWQRPLPVGEKPKKRNEAPSLYSDHGIMLTDEQVHVPLVVVGPGVPAGARVVRSVSLVDVAPTLRRLADLPASGAPVLVAGADLFEESVTPRPVYSFCSRSTSLTLDDRWRLIVPSKSRAETFGDRPSWFDLRTDPLELAGRSPADDAAGWPVDLPDLAHLTAQLEAFRQLATPAAELGADEDAARRALLDDLGYVDQ